MAHAEVSVFMFVEFCAGGDQAQFPWPAHGQVVCGEIGGVAEVWIPTFAGAHEEDVIAGIGDDVAAIVKANRKFTVAREGVGKYDEQEVVAAYAALLGGHVFILKIFELLAIRAGNGFNIQCAGQSENQETMACAEGAEIYGGGSVERVVG